MMSDQLVEIATDRLEVSRRFSLTAGQEGLLPIDETPGREQARSLEQGPYHQTPAELDRFKQYSQCINCLMCYSACPQYGLNPEFTGPAVLSLLHRAKDKLRRGLEPGRRAKR